MALVGLSNHLVWDKLAAIGLRDSLLQIGPFLVAQMVHVMIELRFECERDPGELLLPLWRPGQHAVEKFPYLIFGHGVSMSHPGPARATSMQRI